MKDIKMMFYSLICRILPKQLIAMCVVYHSQKNMKITVLELFDRLTSEGEMGSHCLNCGERVYRGLCTNCHEENYIENQYMDLNEPVPESIYKKARENEREVYLNPVDDNPKRGEE